jgi:hypothetical protein
MWQRISDPVNTTLATQNYTPRATSVNIPQMGELTGTGCLGPFAGKGTQVDAWAEVIEGMSAKAPLVVQAFDTHIQDKQVPTADIRTESLTAPGFGAEKRIYYMIRRVPALVAVYIAGLGSDLYVSWRLFVKAPISKWRVAAWLLTAAVFPLCNILFSVLMSVSFIGYGGLGQSIQALILMLVFGMIGFVVGTLTIAAVLALIAGLLGYWVARDFLYFWRVPLNEFHEDDIAALTVSVHKALLGAVDAVGIDTKLLRIKEHFGVARGRLI